MRSGFHPSRQQAQEETLKGQGFYHKPAWRKLRLLALQRDHYLCQACLRGGKITPATEVHHIRELEDFPELGLELSNLESLCWNCHEETKKRGKEKAVAVAASRGVRVLRISNGEEMAGWKDAD